MQDFTIVNGRVLRPSGLAEEALHISAGAIAEECAGAVEVLDADGAYVLPGIVDVHGDGFERVIMPRPDVFFPLDLALLETDRQLIANGITTAFHCLSISWEAGLRSLERTRAVHEAIGAARSRLACNTRVHLRWETFALDEVEGALEMLQGEDHALLSFNDHTTAMLQKRMSARKLNQMAERCGITPEAYQERLEAMWERREEVSGAIVAMADRAKAAGAILMAHDERSAEERRWFRGIGAFGCEFPITHETAEEARAHGEHVVLGAPNVVRGASHTGALDATSVVEARLCTVLASDYYYPSQLHAAFGLVRRGIGDLPSIWPLVSLSPAQLGGLADRGELLPGKRADVIVVNWDGEALPQVKAVFAGGRLAYHAH